MPKAWRLAQALEVLREQVNERAPGRSKKDDGTIGDAAHSSRKSDHNPNSAGVVCAIDITHDPEKGMDAHHLAQALRTSQDARIKYVIFDSRIFASYSTASRAAWSWGRYGGSNSHSAHIHVSVKGEVDSPEDWEI